MTERIKDRLHGKSVDDKVLVKALRTGKYVDQFTTENSTPEEITATLSRLPKCLQKS